MNASPNPTKTEFSIHPQTRLGHVSLTAASLENEIAFYQQALGFQVHWREGKRAGLGSGGADLLRLVEESNVKKYNRVTGLYHVAYLFPDQRELAKAVARLIVLKYPNSPTDHIMTKTTYLDDLESNGIELYAESPEDGTWTMKDGAYITTRRDGSLSDGREPLDLDALFAHLNEDDKLDISAPPETRVGHVHLHVRDIDEALDFYHGVLGFDVMGNVRNFQMAFVSAGGYHHHIGLNTWQGRGAPPPPPDAVGLRHFTVELPDRKAMDEIIARVDAAGLASNMIEDGLLVHDPSQNGIVLTVKGK
ncbi:MAG: Catechol-2,3-dioxygenase [Anaerolineales bacterium]|nr:Catechol-2,3-dioxygenase [Anaerolineales bacterium]